MFFKRVFPIAALIIIPSFNTFANTEEDNKVGTLPLDELRTFTEVFAKVKMIMSKPLTIAN